MRLSALVPLAIWLVGSTAVAARYAGIKPIGGGYTTRHCRTPSHPLTPGVTPCGKGAVCQVIADDPGSNERGVDYSINWGGGECTDAVRCCDAKTHGYNCFSTFSRKTKCP